MTDNSALGRIYQTAQKSGSDPVVSGQTTFLFDVDSTSTISSIFTVADQPLTISIYNLSSVEGEGVSFEMVVFDPTGAMFTQPLFVDGQEVLLALDNVQIELNKSGLYRCILEGDGALGEVIVTATNNKVPSGIINHGK